MPGRRFHGTIATAESTLQYELVSSLGSLNFIFVSYLKLPQYHEQLSLLVCSFGNMHYLVDDKLVFLLHYPAFLIT